MVSLSFSGRRSVQRQRRSVDSGRKSFVSTREVPELEKLQTRWQLEGVPRHILLQAFERIDPSRSENGEGENSRLTVTALMRLRRHRQGQKNFERRVKLVAAAVALLLTWALICDIFGSRYNCLGCGVLRAAHVMFSRMEKLVIYAAILMGIGVSAATGLKRYASKTAGDEQACREGRKKGGGKCPLGFGDGPAELNGDMDLKPVEGDEGESLPRATQELGWQAKQGRVVKFLVDGSFEGSKVDWPATSDVGNDVFYGDYSTLLTSEADTHDRDSDKLLCHAGAVAQVRIEFFRGHGYSGLFSEGELEGIVRLSSAMAPVTGLPSFSGQISRAKVFPCAAVKVFRDNVASGNLLFGGSKTGQTETNFFEHCQCSHMTEKVGLMLRPILERFRGYSNYPTQLGLSDFAKFGQDGNPAEALSFPWCLVLRPGADVQRIAREIDRRFQGEPEANEQVNFVEQILALPENSLLFDIFAVPDPDAALVGSSIEVENGSAETGDERSSLIRIGRMWNTSRFFRSTRENQLFFKHQRKEEDYDLTPEWFSRIRPQHQLYGSKEFERRLQQGLYYDLGPGETSS